MSEQWKTDGMYIWDMSDRNSIAVARARDSDVAAQIVADHNIDGDLHQQLAAERARREALEAEVERLRDALRRDRCVCIEDRGVRHESHCEDFRASVDRIRERAGLPMNQHRIDYADNLMSPASYRARCACGWITEWNRDFKAIETLALDHLAALAAAPAERSAPDSPDASIPIEYIVNAVCLNCGHICGSHEFGSKAARCMMCDCTDPSFDFSVTPDTVAPAERTASSHAFVPMSGSQDTGGRYTRCSVMGCPLGPDQHSTERRPD
jgi:hypothetical protein